MKSTSTRIVLFFLVAGVALAQGTREDYARAERVLRGALTDLIVDGQVSPNWIRQTSRFWYRKAGPSEEKEFVLVDAERGIRGPAFDHAKLAAALSKAAGKTYGARTLPFDRFTFTGDGKEIEVSANGTRYSCDLASYNCAARGPAGSELVGPPGRGGRGDAPEGRREPGRSPDGNWVAFARDNNLWVRSVVAGQEYPLTRDGAEQQPYAKGWPNLGDFVREATGEAGIGAVAATAPVEVSWSPDSTKLATFRLDMRMAPPAFALQVNPPNRFLPFAYKYAYAYPAAPVLPTAKTYIFDLKTGKRVEVDAPPEEILYGGGSNVSWFKNGKAIWFRHQERGFGRIELMTADAETGKSRILIDEKSKDYVEAAKFRTTFVNNETEIVMTSERDGWNHIYLHDAATGAEKNRITGGEWAVRSIDRIDEEGRVIYFSAGGKEPGEDPYLRRLYRVNFDGSNLKLLTPENADHQVTFSPEGKYFVDNYSRVDLPTIALLRRSADGSVVLELEKTDISKLVASGWKQPERFHYKGRDGKTDIYGVLWRPTTFDPSKKYAVIEQIYAGPQGFFAPATFAAYRNGCQVMAELGALCVMIDGMGTDGRSHAFHAVAWKNLGDGGLPDHIAVLKQLAAKYPYVDLARGVGIYGHSAGGYNSTHALLTHPEFYKVAVSSAGNHDHRLDKAGWVEQWMSHPAGKWYEEQSNITLAPKLEGKLMLAVGEVDDNVTPVSTLKLAAALVQANKDFDLLIMPNYAHGFGNDPYFVRRRWDFFVRHLLGVTPPENYMIAPEGKPLAPR
jgi:dipeptidyl aminopeptidase/acylaminoacyl peptidase